MFTTCSSKVSSNMCDMYVKVISCQSNNDSSFFTAKLCLQYLMSLTSKMVLYVITCIWSHGCELSIFWHTIVNRLTDQQGGLKNVCCELETVCRVYKQSYLCFRIENSGVQIHVYS